MTLAVKKGQDLHTLSSKDVDHSWRWRSGDGDLWDPKDMETRHAFYTIRMIWNNSVPEHMRVGEVRLYSFPKFYTPSYMRAAVIRVGAELLTRKDMRPEWKKQLEEIASWFREYEFMEVHVIGGPRPLLEAPR